MTAPEIVALDDAALARLAETPLTPGVDVTIDGGAWTGLAADVLLAIVVREYRRINAARAAEESE